ncbi:MAG: AraC family transcriptional regulator [Nitriliruptor sp.]
MDLEVVRAATSVELLVALGVEHGLSAEQLLAPAGLSGRELSAPDAEVTAGEELAVVRALVAALGDPPGLGLAAGGRYHLTSYGIWGFALISSPTLRAAVDVGLRHLGLTYALTEIEVVVTPPDVRIVLGDAELPSDVRRFVVERDAAALRTVQRDLFGDDVALRRVTFRAPTPPEPEVHAGVFGGPVTFGASVNEVVIDAAALDTPLPRADARTAALAEAQCEQLLDVRLARAGTAGAVRQRLLHDPSDPPTMAEVAAERHVTERTLRRQLAAEGTSFRHLIDEVRSALAHELLVEAGLTVDQTARRLGFVEPASFVHAFRRWTGTTPGAYRDLRRRGFQLRSPRHGGGVR